MDNMNPIGNGFNFPHFHPLHFRDYRNYLPTAYDDSLSMQESLLQVLNFCNEIGLLNQNMSDNWNMLLGWLKRQGIDDSLTSILNQWVVDGTMAKILDKTALKDIEANIEKWKDSIVAQLKLKATTYDNVDAMVNDSGLTVGATAITKGYYQPNDGGGSTYIITNRTASTMVDGGSGILLNNGMIAELIIDHSTIMINQFGAKGDGVTDDTDKIQLALDYTSKFNLILSGDKENTFLISKTLNITNAFNIDLNHATIKANGAIQALLAINTDKADNTKIKQSSIQNIRFDCTNVSVGLTVSSRRVYLESLQFDNILNIGLNLTGGYEITVSNSNFTGMGLANIAIKVDTTDNYIHHCYGTDNNKFIVNTASGNVFESNHAWIYTGTILPNSIFLTSTVTALATGNVADTYETSFSFPSASTFRLINNQSIINATYYNSNTDPKAPTFIVLTATDLKALVYKPVIKNNWVQFPSTRDTGLSSIGSFINIDINLLQCSMSGNSGSFTGIDARVAVVPTSSLNIVTSPSYVTYENGSCELTVRYALKDPIPTDSDTVVGTLPIGFRPFRSFYCTWGVGGNVDSISAICYGFVNSNGNIIIKNTSGTPMFSGVLRVTFKVWTPSVNLDNIGG